VSDELDEETRYALWRRRCPSINVDEFAALDPVHADLLSAVARAGSGSRVHVPSGPEWMLAGFRAGWRARSRTAATVDVNDLVVAPGSAWPEQRFVVLRIERGDDDCVEVLAQRCPPHHDGAPITIRGPRDTFRPAEPDHR
jgi:hypothetical protein